MIVSTMRDLAAKREAFSCRISADGQSVDAMIVGQVAQQLECPGDEIVATAPCSLPADEPRRQR